MAGGNTRPTEEESATALLIRATEILERVVGDPRGLRAETEALVAESRAAGDWAALVAALRALAEAHRLLHDHERAVPLLDEAVRVARRHGYDGRLGEALLTRGILRLELGDPAGAGRDLDRAAALLENRDSGVEADIQRAALAQNVGRSRRAAAIYAGVLRRPDLGPALRTRAANNLGVIEAALGNHEEAAAQLEAATRSAAEVGPAYVALVAESYAWATVKAGHLTDGVARFDHAARLWQRAEMPLAELYTEYSDALADLRLLPEAREQAERAASMLSGQGVALMADEARLRVAGLALAMGDARAAEQVAEQAAESLRRQRRASWRARARLVAVQARLSQGTVRGDDHTLAVRAARVLLESGLPDAAVDAFITAGRVARATGRPRIAQADWEHAAAAAPAVPALARIKGHLARALAAQARRSDTELLRACGVGLSDVAHHRAALPSTELRALASGHGAELSALGLGAVVRTRPPAQVLAWMERTRTGALSTIDPGPSDGLDDELGALRAVHTEIARARRTDRGSLPALMSRQDEIEARIRHGTWTGSSGLSPGLGEGRGRLSLKQLRAALGDRVLVEYDVLEGRVVAVVVEQRRTRLVQLGESTAMEADIDALRSALQALTVCVPAMAGFLRDTATDLVASLSRVLVEPLGLGPASGVVVVPVGELQRVPWSAMFDRPVSVAPSATLWLDTCRRTATVSTVVLAAGPWLDGAVDEVEALAGRHAQALVLVPPESGVEAVRKAIDGAALAHLSCHGEVRADNPTFSSLLLADGRLTLHEIDRLAGVPHRLVLAACDVGGSVTYPGNEVLGFIGTLLTRGTAGVVGSTTLVLDSHVTPLMLALHDGIRAGQTLAEALHAARAATDLTDPRAYPAWCSFTAYGAA
jgi:tetratricopeptide (TPR) repeat protein